MAELIKVAKRPEPEKPRYSFGFSQAAGSTA